MKVYLTGGTHPEWRANVIEECSPFPEIEFLEPSPEVSPQRAMPRNLTSIEACDVVLAFIDRGSSGLNTALELGFAKAVGKTLMLVNERDVRGAEALYVVAHVFNSLEEAIIRLPRILL